MLLISPAVLGLNTPLPGNGAGPPVSSGHGPPPTVLMGDWVVDKDTTLKDEQRGIQGNIKVLDGATLTLDGSVIHVVQDSSDDFDVILLGSGSLTMQGSRLFTDASPLDIDGQGNGAIKLSGSTISLAGGEVRGTSASFALVSSSLEGRAWRMNAAMTVSGSSLAVTTANISAAADFSSSKISGSVLVTAPDVRMTDTSVGSIAATGAGQASLFRNVDLLVRDGLSLPVAKLDIKMQNVDDSNLSIGVTTPANGSVRQPLIYGIVTPDPTRPIKYLGNWRFSTDLGTEHWEKVRSIPEYGHPDYPPNFALAIPLRSVARPAPESSDYLWKLTATLGGNGRDGMVFDGNLRIQGAKLTLGPGAVLNFTPPGERSVIVEAGSELALAGARFNGVRAVYVEDTGKVTGAGLNMDGGIAGVNGAFLAASVLARGGMGGDFSEISSKGLKLLGQMTVKAGKIALNSSEFGDDVSVETADLAIEKVRVQGAMDLVGVPASIEVRSLEYGSISLPNGTTMRRDWRLDVTVLNGHDRLVPDATISVKSLDPEGDVPVPAAQLTGSSGTAGFWLLGDIVTDGGLKTEYKGNYLLNSSVTKPSTRYADPIALGMDRDRDLEVRFPEGIVPPLTVTLAATISAGPYEPGARIAVSGDLVYTETSEPVPAANITLSFRDASLQPVTVRTDDKGHFSGTINAPSAEGEYTFRIEALDPETDFKASQEMKIRVQKTEIVPFFVLVIALLVGLCVVALGIVSWRRKTQEFKERVRDPVFSSRVYEEVDRRTRDDPVDRAARRELGAEPPRPPGKPENGDRGRKRKLGTDGGLPIDQVGEVPKGAQGSKSPSILLSEPKRSIDLPPMSRRP